MKALEKLGWCARFDVAFQPYREQDFQVGRISVENRDCFSVITEHGELTAEVSGRLLFNRESAADLPKVGDWAVLQMFESEQKAIIHDLLPRKTRVSRKASGKTVDEQVLAANIDVIFIVQSLDRNFNLRRLERSLVMVNEGGARPAIILNKIDLCDDFEQKVAEAREIAGGAPVLPLSAKSGDGVAGLRKMIGKTETFAFIGSSGVGKSTLINSLIGAAVQKTAEVRSGDSKGRHTTTRRELIVLPQGGCLIDTPGMRELHLWHAEEGLQETFQDIEELAKQCHFSDCTHTREKRCAVLAALASGELEKARHESYLKLQGELEFLESKRSKNSYETRKKERTLGKLYKQIQSQQRKRKKLS